MKKIYTLAILFLCAVSNVSSQAEFQWAHQFGGSSGAIDQSTQMQTDSQGNIYLCGVFQNEMDMDPGLGEYILTSATTAFLAGNGFVAKYTSEGELVWADMLSSTSACGVTGMVLDTDENPIISGFFNSNVDTDPSGGFNTFNSNGNIDTFVGKYDKTNGNLIWSFSLGNSGVDYPAGMKSDGNGNFVLLGYFGLTIDFDGSAGVAEYTSEGDYNNIFFARYDDDGNFIWVRHITSSDPGTDIFWWPDALDFDPDGNLLIAGNFSYSADFDPSENTYELAGVEWFGEGFFAKYTADGDFVFARGFIGADETQCHAIVSDDEGNIYVAGYFTGTVDMDSGAGETLLEAEEDFQDIFFARFDASGTLIWAKQLRGVEEGNHARARGITLDDDGNIYMACTYRLSSMDVDPGAGQVILDANDNHQIFIGKYDPDGNFLNVSEIHSPGAVNTYANITDLILVGETIYVAAYFEHVVDVDCSPEQENLLTSTGDSDFFFAKYLADLTDQVHETTPSGSLMLYPNPASDVLWIDAPSGLLSPSGMNISIYSSSGQLVLRSVYKTKLNIETLKPGIYTIEMNGRTCHFIKQ